MIEDLPQDIRAGLAEAHRRSQKRSALARAHSRGGNFGTASAVLRDGGQHALTWRKG